MSETNLLILVVFGLVTFLVYQDRARAADLKWLLVESRAERKELLDRIMARDFAQYKQAAVIEQVAPKFAEYPGASMPDLGLEDVGS